ncbi:hypothetical protein FHS89_000455 [Rubricella aquisinus]|uniref:Exopolysaccharide biosynthesis protein n=1 Tax=Rubricella aquisinus TaxID=2028108 RepID=A0A840X1C1_9RHOB|nr:exopolysaccharide biosynthesis protein [Rubricella aquisinus]MBB5514457.1 hypothetical protein [Rubricella aquisinus]
MTTAYPKVSEVIAETRSATTDGRVSIGVLMERLGPASTAASLLVPAMIVVTPLSGVPLLSSFCGLMIAMIALQMVAGRRHVWLPDWIMRRSVDGARLDGFLRRLETPAGFIDRRTRRRLLWMVRPPGALLIKTAAMMCGLAMPFLEVFPMTSSLLAVAVCFFAIALLARDGVLALIGLAFIGGTGWAGFFLVSTAVTTAATLQPGV